MDTRLTHPEYCLFADETGCNTSRKKMAVLLEQGTKLKKAPKHNDWHLPVRANSQSFHSFLQTDSQFVVLSSFNQTMKSQNLSGEKELI